jgi:micrococcal nuclease
MRHQNISMLLLLLLILPPASSWAWQGKVVDISNGDAITVLHDGKEEKVFLYGINCPRQRQNFGPESKNFTSQMVTGRIVEVKPMLVDSSGRTIVIVSVDGMSLNEELVKAGLASVLVQYCRDTFCPMWIRNQEEAQIKKIGLWSTENLTPPSEFRRENKPLENTLPNSSSPKQTSEEVHGDIVTHVFHSPGCRNYDCPNCIAHFKSRNQALRAGYKPCGECNP